MEIDLEGQTALVVGRRTPIADAICAALLRNGASVSVSEPGEREPKAALDLAIDTAGRLDVLVMIANHHDGASTNLPEADDLRPALGAQASEANSYMRAAADALANAAGRVVIVASALGLLPARDDPLTGAADAGLFQLMRGFAMQLGPRGIRINAVALGAIGSGAEGDEELPAVGARRLSHVPLKRTGTAQEVADALLFLVDPQNTYMTGHILAVDGGWVAGFARDF